VSYQGVLEELDQLRLNKGEPVTHPDVYTDHTVTLTVARSLQGGFDIGTTTSMDDNPTAKHVLRVKFLGTDGDKPDHARQKGSES